MQRSVSLNSLSRPNSRPNSRPCSQSSARDCTARRNLERGVEPVGELPSQLRFSPIHTTSSVPSGIGECVTNNNFFKMPDVEKLPKRPSSQSAPRPRQRESKPKAPPNLRYSKDVLPKTLTDLDYWGAVDLFDLADTLKDGTLEKYEFHQMLFFATRSKEQVSREESDAIFDALDLNQSGRIDRDEFLGWIFNTHSAYCGGIRKRMEHLNDGEVQEFFVNIDRDGSGKVSRNEFFFFANHFLKNSGGMTREDSNLLFRQIDADRSGEIEAKEFLDWINPARKLARMAKPEKLVIFERSTWKAKRKKEDEPPKQQQPTSVTGNLFELTPGKPIVLEITAGRNYVRHLNNLLKSLNYKFGKGRLKITGRFDLTCDHVSKLVVKIGRGIVLWDRGKMMMHMEDPFENHVTTFKFLSKVIVENLPEIIPTMQSELGAG